MKYSDNEQTLSKVYRCPYLLFIASELIELESQLILSNKQLKMIYGELRKDDPEFDMEEYSKDVEEGLRTLRLKLSAVIIKRYS